MPNSEISKNTFSYRTPRVAASVSCFRSGKSGGCARVSFIIKLQAEACNFIKKETLAQVFSCEFCKILTPFLTERLWWLLLEDK